jgi:hypothetical protein
MRRMFFLLLILVVTLPLAGASAQGPDLIGPATYPANINPLTGLSVDDPAVLDRRPLIVKIVNAPAEARPQWGLMQADIVWEYLLSGGWTRFAAVYLSESPKRVGPVRSLRLVDFELVRIYNSLIAASGMSIGTRDVLKKDPLMLSRLISGSSPCPALCRDPEVDRKWEFTLFGDTEEIRVLAEEMGKDTAGGPSSGMAFSANIPPGGRALDSVEIEYRAARVTWTYDPDRAVWLREHDGEVHLDAISGQQLYTDNVVILEEEHTVQPYMYENYWGYENFAFSTNFIGSGRAILLRDGQYIEGTWQRDSREDALHFYDLQGNVLPFKPGRTFFNLVPRWQDGYQLVLRVPDPATLTIAASSVNLRWGPNTYFGAADAAFQGDVLPVIGRNNHGSWVQVLVDDKVLWVATELVTLSGDVMDLPLVRPTIEV